MNSNSEKEKKSLTSILDKYDSLYNSFFEKSSDEIIGLKKHILFNTKYLIEDTFSHLITLKKTLKDADSSYINMINDSYQRLLDLIMLPYGFEVEKINNSLKPSVFINSISFNPYINFLIILLKNISDIECQIKSKIEFSLSTIIKNKSELELFKYRVKTQSFADKISQVFSSKDNHRLKISLTDISNNKKSQNQPSEIDTNKVGFNSSDQPYEDFINKAIQEMKD
tara:strand:+ start:622 stop:1299 length:678 start_codon:yes stop_codon:yes gene_type:complete